MATLAMFIRWPGDRRLLDYRVGTGSGAGGYGVGTQRNERLVRGTNFDIRVEGRLWCLAFRLGGLGQLWPHP